MSANPGRCEVEEQEAHELHVRTDEQSTGTEI